jgi:hypothetical protein
MHRSTIASLISRVARRCRSRLQRVAAFGVTIRGRILIAFLIMSMITAALGGYATKGITDAAVLVD